MLLWSCIFQICVQYETDMSVFSHGCLTSVYWVFNDQKINYELCLLIVSIDHVKLLKEKRYKDILVFLSVSRDFLFTNFLIFNM